ncbi:DUF6577 family protein [Cyclobacterium jeungdonense]|uniref:DUF6577 family protein n=1 Tax=Cyclobacterium jeungdonense TaxID=708087 RepID=UPI00338DA012
MKEGTFEWRIYELKDKKIIKPLKKRLYVISYKPKYRSEIFPELIKLAMRITDKFGDGKR